MVLKDVAYGGVVRTDDRIVPRKAGGLLGDYPKAGRMVVAPGNQRGPGRRAECCGMELGIAQPVGCDLVERRCRDDTAEGSGDAIAGVVGYDQQDIRRAFRRNDGRRPPRLRLLGVQVDDPTECRRLRRQRLAIDGRRGARRAERPVTCCWASVAEAGSDMADRLRSKEKAAGDFMQLPDQWKRVCVMAILAPRRSRDKRH